MSRLCLFMLAVLMMLPGPASGQAGIIVKRAVKEIMEAATRKAGSEGLEEVAALGGEVALREIFEKAAREGGEPAVGRLVAYGTEHGADSLGAFRVAPVRMLQAIDALPGEQVGPALRAAAREPELVSRLTLEYGDRALHAIVAQPGIGTRLVGELGEDGVQAALRLTTPDAVALSRHLDAIAELPPQEREALLSMLSRAPEKVIRFLERHPKTLLISAGASGVYVMRDELFGSGAVTTIGPDGRVTTTGGGFIDRTIQQTLMILRTPLSAILFALALVMIGWGGTKIVFAWRAGRARLDKISGR